MTNQEGDLGVGVAISTKHATAVKKANSTLGVIRKRTENKTVNMIMPLYKSVVKSHWEYCEQFWLPHSRSKLQRLEKVQKREQKLSECWNIFLTRNGYDV